MKEKSAWQDGVVIHMLVIPEIIEGENGKLKYIKFNRSQILKKEDGSWYVEALDDKFDFIYPVDMVVTAIGSETDKEVLLRQGFVIR